MNHCRPSSVEDRDIREAREAQMRYRERFDATGITEVTRLCSVCGLNFHAGYSHAPSLLASRCDECSKQ